VKPPAFEYRAPETLAEALTLLAERGADAKPLAGGQSLVPAMNFRLAAPGMLIDLARIPDLAFVRERDGGLEIGAMTRQRTAERSALVAKRAPLLAETMPWIAHPQIRNRGTVGGSAAHADPAAELPAVLVALEARFRVARAGAGERVIEADDFFPGLFSTALEADELLTAIEIPAPRPGARFAFRELARRHGDYALVGVAVALELDDAERCGSARIVLLSVGDGPVRARGAEDLLSGAALSAEAIAAAADHAAREDIDPASDLHASATYRRHLAEVLVRRALTAAAEFPGNAC